MPHGGSGAGDKGAKGGKKSDSIGSDADEHNGLLADYAKRSDLALYTLISPDQENMLDRIKKLEQSSAEHESLLNKWKADVLKIPGITDDI